MKIEGHNLSPEEKQRTQQQRSRILSDAKLVEKGAQVDTEGKITVTGEQFVAAKEEMGEHFVKETQRLKNILEKQEKGIEREILELQQDDWKFYRVMKKIDLGPGLVRGEKFFPVDRDFHSKSHYNFEPEKEKRVDSCVLEPGDEIQIQPETVYEEINTPEEYGSRKYLQIRVLRSNPSAPHELYFLIDKKKLKEARINIIENERSAQAT